MEWLSDKIDNVLTWLAEFFTSIFNSLMALFNDIFIGIVEMLLQALVYLIGLIPMPGFTNSSMNDLVSGLPQLTLYMMDKTGFDSGLAILASGLAFRLLRKLITAGQW